MDEDIYARRISMKEKEISEGAFIAIAVNIPTFISALLLATLKLTSVPNISWLVVFFPIFTLWIIGITFILIGFAINVIKENKKNE